ncbi:MAG: cytidine deaminase [Chitinophagaceae bacterium]
MERKEYRFDFEVYNDLHELNAEDAALLQQARATTANAYAPYSHFNVGAVAKLANGAIVTGTNQENASYPVGICAERVLLSAAAVLHPNVPIDTLAISYHNLDGDSSKPVSPCGMCRQSLSEYQIRVGQPMRLILSGMDGKVYIIDKADALLPFSFTPDDL